MEDRTASQLTRMAQEIQSLASTLLGCANLLEPLLPKIQRVRQRLAQVEVYARTRAATFPQDAPRAAGVTYPRSAIEVAVLEALARVWPHGETAHRLAQELPYPRREISTVLQALRALETIHTYHHGTYCFGPPVPDGIRSTALGIDPPGGPPPLPPAPPVRERSPSAQYTTVIAAACAPQDHPQPGEDTTNDHS